MPATDPASVAPRPPRFAAVGAGRMGRGIAIAFAWAGHRIALVDLRPRDAAAWQRLHDEALGEIRASLGAIFSMPIAAGSTPATLDWLTGRGITPIAARVDAAAPYTDVDMRGPVAFVLGSEATGLSHGWDDPRVTPVAIPMLGTVDSLNVSVAAAILLYEAVRQRA